MKQFNINKYMKQFWEKRNTNEKVMIGFLLIMLIVIALNWEKVSEGFSKGVQPYNKEATK